MRKVIICISFFLILISCAHCHSNPNLDAQVDSLKKAIKGNSNNPDLYFELGMVYESQGKYGKAKEVLQRSIALNPSYSKAYNLLGSIFEKEKDYTSAAEYYQKAIQSDDRFMEPYILLSSLYRDMGIKSLNKASTQKAIEILKNALNKCDRTKDKDSCITILNNLSVLLLEKETNKNNTDLKLVIEYAEQGLELLKNKEDLNKYAEFYTNKKLINFDRGLFYYLLGEAYRKLNNPTEAINAYDEALNDFRRIDDKNWINAIEDVKRDILVEQERGQVTSKTMKR